jgi:hypothetical protein
MQLCAPCLHWHPPRLCAGSATPPVLAGLLCSVTVVVPFPCFDQLLQICTAPSHTEVTRCKQCVVILQHLTTRRLEVTAGDSRVQDLTSPPPPLKQSPCTPQ